MDKNEYVYCTDCMRLKFDENEKPYCYYESQCDINDCEDSRPLKDRPNYEERKN